MWVTCRSSPSSVDVSVTWDELLEEAVGAWATIPPVYRQMELVARTPTDSLNIKKENSLFEWRKRLSSHVNRTRPLWHSWIPAVVCLTPSPPAHWRVPSTKGFCINDPCQIFVLFFFLLHWFLFIYIYIFLSVTGQQLGWLSAPLLPSVSTHSDFHLAVFTCVSTVVVYRAAELNLSGRRGDCVIWSWAVY